MGSILGWSAFAGIIVLIVAVPLNSFVSKRSIKITQDLLKARDARISVMNELIGAITFIKVSSAFCLYHQCERADSSVLCLERSVERSGKGGQGQRDEADDTM
jgi:hypothetical protein